MISMPAPPLDSLAVELLHKIYEHACTDGGLTGCSLSLVSKRVRAASRPVRFHSIALIHGTPSQVAGFLACYIKERAATAESVCPVRHLCIAAAKQVALRTSRTPGALSQARCSPLEDERKRIAREQDAYHANILSLFYLFAPQIRTLSVVQKGAWQGLPDIDVVGGFPMLEELTVVGHHPFVGPSLLYPRLTKLHMEYSRYGCGPFNIAQWAALAPCLTHLRFSNVSCLTEDLKQVLGDEKPIFKRLAQLYIQPTPPPPSEGHCGTSGLEHVMNMDKLVLFAIIQRELPVHLLPCKKPDTNWARAVGQEWRDAVLGGQGAWPEIALSDDMEETLEEFSE